MLQFFFYIPALPNTLAHCSLEDNKKKQPNKMRACQGRGIFFAILCWFYLFFVENRIVHLWKLVFMFGMLSVVFDNLKHELIIIYNVVHI